MAIITIFSGSYCDGEEIARQVAERLGYERIENKLLTETSRRFRVSEDKLSRAMTGPLPVFNRFTRDREKYVAYLKAVLAEIVLEDNKLLHGYASHLLHESFVHVLNVCVIANFDDRVKRAVQTVNKSEKHAQKVIQKDDKDRLQWTQYLFDKSPYDESLYDVVIPMQDTTVENAVSIICENANSEPILTTPHTLRAAKDFVLSTRVNLALVEAGHSVDVFSQNSIVTLIINQYVVRLEKHQEELKNIALKVDGVKEVNSRVGPKFSPPPIIPMGDLTLPSKFLLVDDEKEFVHTLSERLQTRDIPASVVYDGEQALDFVKKDEPEVMVLDLKMPGIDGIEVLRRVKRDYPNVEVIILTGHGSDREEELAAELGAFAYLHKPVNIDILAQAMREAYQKVNQTKSRLQQDQETDSSGEGEEEAL